MKLTLLVLVERFAGQLGALGPVEPHLHVVARVRVERHQREALFDQRRIGRSSSGPSSAVATAPLATSATPQTSVTMPPRPRGPRQWPISSSERSSVQSGFCSAVSSVQSAWRGSRRPARPRARGCTTRSRTPRPPWTWRRGGNVGTPAPGAVGKPAISPGSPIVLASIRACLAEAARPAPRPSGRTAAAPAAARRRTSGSGARTGAWRAENATRLASRSRSAASSGGTHVEIQPGADLEARPAAPGAASRRCASRTTRRRAAPFAPTG